MLVVGVGVDDPRIPQNVCARLRLYMMLCSQCQTPATRLTHCGNPEQDKKIPSTHYPNTGGNMLLISERIQAGPQCQRSTELAQLNVTKQLVQVHFTGRTCEVKLQFCPCCE